MLRRSRFVKMKGIQAVYSHNPLLPHLEYGRVLLNNRGKLTRNCVITRIGTRVKDAICQKIITREAVWTQIVQAVDELRT